MAYWLNAVVKIIRVSSGSIFESSIPLSPGIWMSQNRRSTGVSFMNPKADVAFWKDPFNSRNGVFLT